LSSMVLKSLVAGGLASMCGKTAVAPLDRIKILFQVHSILLCAGLDSSHDAERELLNFFYTRIIASFLLTLS
jgi:hypothetical protein